MRNRGNVYSRENIGSLEWKKQAKKQRQRQGRYIFKGEQGFKSKLQFIFLKDGITI